MKQRTTNSYFQFPLCALAYGQSPQARLHAIIDYACVETGRAFWRQGSEAAHEQHLASWRNPKVVPCDYDQANGNHPIVLCGASVLEIKIRSVTKCLEAHRCLSDFLTRFELQHGPDAKVRLKASFVWEVIGGSGMSYRELAVLAGLYSVIGNRHRPVRVTRETIRIRALGYKSRAVFEKELAQRADGEEPLTEWQVRDTLKKLHCRKFFAKATYGQRQTFYSNRMTHEALRKAIFEMKVRAYENRDLHRAEDQIMNDDIRNHRILLSGKPPVVPNAKPGLGPRSPEVHEAPIYDWKSR